MEALTVSGRQVVLKGPERGVVFAEASAYELANLIDLPVPPHGLCTVPGHPDPWFCCEKLDGRFPVDYWWQNERLANRNDLYDTIVFDVWIGNHDRNMGNLVLHSEDHFIRLHAIDFERAAVLRGEPDRFTLNTWEARRFWPRERLGRLVRGAAIPWPTCERIQELRESQIDGVMQEVRMDMDLADIPWLDASASALVERKARLRELVQEAWNGE